MGSHPLLTVTSHTLTYSFTVEGKAATIGRSLKCNFNIPREDLSREHCLFEVVDGDFYITDLGSKNGVSVNRMKLIPNQRTLVTTDSTIVLANVYELRINAFDIKTSSHIVYPLPKADLQTKSFSLETKEPVRKTATSPRIRVVKEDQAPKNESLKMIMGFVAVIGLFMLLIGR